MSEGGNGWSEWSRHVLAELERLDASYHEMSVEMARMRESITRLEERLRISSAFFGVLGGAIPAVVVIAWQMLR
jgi:uncharacterized protein (UPF0303 family)